MHPRDALLGVHRMGGLLPVCDHYSGVEARMVKSLQLQAEMREEFGISVFDVTLDCEDGAPVGGEREHAQMVCDLVVRAGQRLGATQADGRCRVGVRVHSVDHHAFESDVETIVGRSSRLLSYVMVPKVETLADVQRAVDAIDAAAPAQFPSRLPVHVLIESPLAVFHAADIAAHPRVESLSFGLMDFVSSHGGAIPASAMTSADADARFSFNQFTHPVVARAKLEVASACHIHGKVPSHCVVTEFKALDNLESQARLAADGFSYTRMWSIHPAQIRPILRAFAPRQEEVDLAIRVIPQAQRNEWGPIAIDGTLHDRASYRLFWSVLERAAKTGMDLPSDIKEYF
jgi:citrate lyase subunit beta/citryl-CoA lyase